MISKFGEQTFSDMDYSDFDKSHYFIFGKETKGLPDWLKDEYKDSLMRIPMTDKVRSLNLANTVGILVYEALRQQNYPNLK